GWRCAVRVGLNERIAFFEVRHDLRIVGQAERRVKDQLSFFFGPFFEKRFPFGSGEACRFFYDLVRGRRKTRWHSKRSNPDNKESQNNRNHGSIVVLLA